MIALSGHDQKSLKALLSIAVLSYPWGYLSAHPRRLSIVKPGKYTWAGCQPIQLLFRGLCLENLCLTVLLGLIFLVRLSSSKWMNAPAKKPLSMIFCETSIQ